MTPEAAHDLLDHNLTNHPPDSPGTAREMSYLRETAKVLGHVIIDVCPDSRERSLALTNLEQTVMWAIAAIARNQP